jgi:hypothetical protein
MVAPIPPRGNATPSATPQDKGPSTDELIAELTASRREVGKAALATHVLKAQSELEGLMQAVRLAQASGDSQHAQALASEAGRIGRTLARIGADHQAVSTNDQPDTITGELAATLRMSRQVAAIAGGGDPDQVSDEPPTDLKA